MRLRTARGGRLLRGEAKRGPSSSEEALLRIIGPNFRAVLRLRGGVVAEAAYMKGWEVARLRALAERWGWKVEATRSRRRRRLVRSGRARALGASREAKNTHDPE